MAGVKDLIEKLSDCLCCGDTEAAVSMVSSDNFKDSLQYILADVIPIICYYLDETALQENKAVFDCCVTLLTIISGYGNPKECLLEFLAQAESLEDPKFEVLLKPIQRTLLCIPERKAPLVQCVFEVIYRYIDTLPLPKDYNLEENAKLLLDCDENVQRLSYVYCVIVDFYEPLVKDLLNGLCEKSSRVQHLKQVTLQALFQLLGKPLTLVNLEYREKPHSSLTTTVTNIFKFIGELYGDVLNCLVIVENGEMVKVSDEKTEMEENFLSNRNTYWYSDLSLSLLFYLIYGENLRVTLPEVYNPLFILHNCLRLSIVLLELPESMAVYKGLRLTKGILGRFAPRSISFSVLDCPVHMHLIQCLSNIAVYHEQKENRKLCVDIIKQYLGLFEPKGCFYVLLNSVNVTTHPGLIGYLITLFKEVVADTFSCDQNREYFTGKRLHDLMKVFCKLKSGAESDIVDSADQIISALNLIIFIMIRDQENFTGVWNFINDLSRSFLVPLRAGLDLSRAHYKQQLNEEKENKSKHEKNAELTVTVSGQLLPKMSTLEKQSVINSALTVFDLIDSLLTRAKECIET